jgi:hypothetical protein
MATELNWPGADANMLQSSRHGCLYNSSAIHLHFLRNKSRAFAQYNNEWPQFSKKVPQSPVQTV